MPYVRSSQSIAGREKRNQDEKLNGQTKKIYIYRYIRGSKVILKLNIIRE